VKVASPMERMCGVPICLCYAVEVHTTAGWRMGTATSTDLYGYLPMQHTPILIAPLHEGMARMSWPGWLYRDGVPSRRWRKSNFETAACYQYAKPPRQHTTINNIMNWRACNWGRIFFLLRDAYMHSASLLWQRVRLSVTLRYCV